MPDASHSFERADNALICQKRSDGLVQRLRALALGGGLQASCRKWARCVACGLADHRIKITRQSHLANGVQRYKRTTQQIVSRRRQARAQPDEFMGRRFVRSSNKLRAYPIPQSCNPWPSDPRQHRNRQAGRT
jgi:hypothetical protein